MQSLCPAESVSPVKAVLCWLSSEAAAPHLRQGLAPVAIDKDTAYTSLTLSGNVRPVAHDQHC